MVSGKSNYWLSIARDIICCLTPGVLSEQRSRQNALNTRSRAKINAFLWSFPYCNECNLCFKRNEMRKVPPESQNQLLACRSSYRVTPARKKNPIAMSLSPLAMHGSLLSQSLADITGSASLSQVPWQPCVQAGYGNSERAAAPALAKLSCSRVP